MPDATEKEVSESGGENRVVLDDVSLLQFARC